MCTRVHVPPKEAEFWKSYWFYMPELIPERFKHSKEAISKNKSYKEQLNKIIKENPNLRAEITSYRAQQRTEPEAARAVKSVTTYGRTAKIVARVRTTAPTARDKVILDSSAKDHIFQDLS